MSGLLKSKKQVIFWDDLIPLILPLTMLVFVDLTVINLYKVIGLWMFIIGAASFMYSLVAVNAGHHGPSNVHEGDEVLSLDFGIFQLGATIDRKEANSNQFMVLTHFGEHILVNQIFIIMEFLELMTISYLFSASHVSQS